jgi:hypothetical protein
MASSYRVAGIDVHKNMLAVVITDAAVEGEFRFERRKFGTLDSELTALKDWLMAHQVQEAVMESTAQSGSRYGGVWKGSAGCTWRKPIPIERRMGERGISGMRSDWCAVMWLGN